MQQQQARSDKVAIKVCQGKADTKLFRSNLDRGNDITWYQKFLRPKLPSGHFGSKWIPRYFGATWIGATTSLDIKSSFIQNGHRDISGQNGHQGISEQPGSGQRHHLISKAPSSKVAARVFRSNLDRGNNITSYRKFLHPKWPPWYFGAAEIGATWDGAGWRHMHS